VDDPTTQPLTLGIEGVVKGGALRRYANFGELRAAFSGDECELALLPITDAFRLPNIVLAPCSSASIMGASRMMMFFSKRMPTEVHRVLVDKEDYGATQLAQLLLPRKVSVRAEYVRSEVPLDPATYDLMQDDGFDAYLLTGRNGFFVRKDAFSFALDLTQAWYEYARLPFVMHVWVMKKGLKLNTLEKELGDVARRNEAQRGAASSATQTGASSSGVLGLQTVYAKAYVTVFDPTIIQAIRRYGQELVQNRVMPALPVTIYTAPSASAVMARKPG